MASTTPHSVFWIWTAVWGWNFYPSFCLSLSFPIWICAEEPPCCGWTPLEPWSNHDLEGRRETLSIQGSGLHPIQQDVGGGSLFLLLLHYPLSLIHSTSHDACFPHLSLQMLAKQKARMKTSHSFAGVSWLIRQFLDYGLAPTFFSYWFSHS